MSCSSLTLSLVRGESARYLVTITDEDGVPVDLTGATIYWRVKAMATDADPALIAKSSADVAEIAILDQTDDELLGKLELYLVPADTASLTPGSFVFELRAVLADSTNQAAARGVLLLEREVVTLP